MVHYQHTITKLSIVSMGCKSDLLLATAATQQADCAHTQGAGGHDGHTMVPGIVHAQLLLITHTYRVIGQHTDKSLVTIFKSTSYKIYVSICYFLQLNQHALCQV